jgi:hypothetical protein
MRYVCLVYGEERAFAGREGMATDCIAYLKGVRAEGRILASSPLQPVSTSATVRLRGGKTLVMRTSDNLRPEENFRGAVGSTAPRSSLGRIDRSTTTNERRTSWRARFS